MSSEVKILNLNRPLMAYTSKDVGDGGDERFKNTEVTI
jgi:hypothetical protein